ncbi:Uncharacterized membrane protein [Faunimonas pinastri]|uniref:Uncharacterized membrane protein n=1 Tax=Faunimonas pinastri TaxID=1855383 RepID=A0A1H9JDF0_9HYPH|nr:NnrU family protein [Faunimonas pinastri]SEQ84787.1 Uncharacterized membrane protein [Faunimonas pinastri]
MPLLIIGLILFLGSHSVRIFAPAWRERQIERFGRGPWRVMHSVASLVGLILLVWGYQTARQDPTVVWLPPYGMNHLAILLNFFTFVLFAAYFVPAGRLKPALGHPMVLAVKVWALAHLLANGTLNDIVLFGAFLVWAIADYALLRRRDRQSGIVRVRGPVRNDILAVVLGAVLWAVILFWLHRAVVGVSPLY